MKKILVLSLSFFFVTFSVAQRRKNCSLNVRDSVFREISTKDSTVIDSATFFKKFDSLIVAYKIRAIYFVNNGTNSSHYMFPGIIFINTKSKIPLVNKLIFEMSHAEQFAKRPVFYIKKVISSCFRSFSHSIIKRKKYKIEAEKLMRENKCSRTIAYFWIAYREEEHNSKTFEYEAHKIIEPKIRSVLWGIPKVKERKIIVNR